MTSVPPGASTRKVDPCEAKKAFALPLISVEDYARRVLGYG
jgi:hypothetical protein